MNHFPVTVPETARWEFLTPVQKTGSPLPREAIARRCARDFALLRFLCVSARRAAAAAAESSSRQGGSGGAAVSAATAAGRAKLFSFYAAVVVEALASLGSASEPLLRALVPTVVHGLSATRSPEYQVGEVGVGWGVVHVFFFGGGVDEDWGRMKGGACIYLFAYLSRFVTEY